MTDTNFCILPRWPASESSRTVCLCSVHCQYGAESGMNGDVCKAFLWYVIVDWCLLSLLMLDAYISADGCQITLFCECWFVWEWYQQRQCFGANIRHAVILGEFTVKIPALAYISIGNVPATHCVVEGIPSLCETKKFWQSITDVYIFCK